MEPVPQAGATGAVNEPVYNTPVTETAATPAPAAVPVATPAPVVAPPPPKAKFFDGITLPDVIVGTLIIAGLGLAIYYFRQRIKHAGREYPELRTDVDKLKQQLEDMNSNDPVTNTQFGI
jgi:hypothetical protein